MIDKKEVKHIAELARLGLTEEELSSMHKTFSSMLDYIETLKEVDVSSIDDVFSQDGIKNITREDKEKGCKKEDVDNLIDLFPNRENDYLKTKKIL